MTAATGVMAPVDYPIGQLGRGSIRRGNVPANAGDSGGGFDQEGCCCLWQGAVFCESWLA
jgi:hypothetical protein